MNSTIMKVKSKKCAWHECNREFVPRYRSTEKHCSSECFYKSENSKPQKQRSKSKINPQSERRKREAPIYRQKRKEFLKRAENSECVIKGTNCTLKATTIEHSQGREGYADDWARQNDVTLFLDERSWKPACLNCNLELENNSELSQLHQKSKIHGGTKIIKK